MKKCFIMFAIFVIMLFIAELINGTEENVPVDTLAIGTVNIEDQMVSRKLSD